MEPNNHEDVRGNSSPNFPSFDHSISVKLNEKNFLLWKQQILPCIRGRKLLRFLQGPAMVPPEFLTPEDEELGVVNQEFLDWEQQDQLLLSWLLSSLSNNMLTRVVGCHTSWQLWDHIHVFFQSHTRPKIRQFRSELRNTKKNDKTISEYLLRIKVLIDSLLSVGDPVSVQEHIDVILDGLPEEYDSFITSITSRLEPYTVAELESLLLAHESRLEKHAKFVSDAFSANVAHLPNAAKPDPVPQGLKGYDSSSITSHPVLPMP